MNRLFALATAIVFCIGASASAEWATLRGQFLYGDEGTAIPSKIKLVPDKDVQVCGKEQLFEEKLVVNPENRGIANVILWAYKPKKKHPDLMEAVKTPVKMDNIGCRFAPHAVAVMTGQTFRVGNPDPVGHNSLINFLKNPGVNPIIPAGAHVDFNLTKAELIPVKVSCSIHNWMQGIVLVQDHPYMAVTDEDGKFELKHLPAGKLTLKVWHEKSAYVQTVEIDGKKTSWKKGRYSPNLKPGKDEEHVYVLDPKIFNK